ncbi:MAG: pyridoxamine 5'-phosphate oxidase family protein [Gemmatimonadota bacterium]
MHEHLEPEFKELADLIHDIKVTMLTTSVVGDGLRSRPMYTQDTPFDGTLWFLTSIHSPVVGEILANGGVLLTYAHPGKQEYITVNGTADILDDRSRIAALWKAAYKVWFPRGENDPDIRLIRVAVERAEYWDAPSAPVRLIQFAKALISGEQMEGGKHGTVKLSGRS